VLYPLSYGRTRGVNVLVYCDLRAIALSLVAIRRVLARRCECNRIATRSIEPLHLLLQAEPTRVEVRVRLIDCGMAEHVPHLMQGPASLEPAAAGLVS
jgi:hypothetical protein